MTQELFSHFGSGPQKAEAVEKWYGWFFKVNLEVNSSRLHKYLIFLLIKVEYVITTSEKNGFVSVMLKTKSKHYNEPTEVQFFFCNFLSRVSLNAVLFDVIPIITLPVGNTTGSFNTQEETIDQTMPPPWESSFGCSCTVRLVAKQQGSRWMYCL